MSKRAVEKYNYNIYHICNDYLVYIGSIQLSSEVLQKYHLRVIFLQNFQGQLYISYIHLIIIIYAATEISDKNYSHDLQNQYSTGLDTV